MAYNKELSRLLSMRRPSTVYTFTEEVKDPTDFSHQVKQATFKPNPKLWGKNNFEKPEVDFAALRKAGRTEPFFRRRANRIQNLLWKNGYDLETEDEAAKEYVMSRMEIFAVLTGQSFDMFMREVSRELIMFDNCLIWERRLPVSELEDMGVTIPIKGIGDKRAKGPVVAYEIIPMDTIRYKRDKFGNIIAWQQHSTNGETKEYPADEVIQIKNDAESGDVLSYPALQMVLPDARILRQLETDASLVAHRLAFPIFKYRVGDPKYEGSVPKKDVDLTPIWYTLEGMLMEGALIIPGTDDFEVVLSDVKMEGLNSILEYFKKRVIVGMGLSPIHMGENDANRSVTDRLDVQLYDDVKAYQKTLEEVFTLRILFKWLREGGFRLRIGDQGVSTSRVALHFREIDTDSLIKRQNHEMSLWVQDGIDHDELRQALGKTPKDDTTKFYSDLIGSISAKHQQTVDKAKAQQTAGGANQGSNAKTKAKKTSSLEQREIVLENDFVTILNSMRDYSIDNSAKSVVTNQWEAFEKEVTDYILSRYTTSFNMKELIYLKELFMDELSNSLRPSVLQSMRFGVDRAYEEARSIDPDIALFRVTVFNRNATMILRSMNHYVDKLVTDLFERIDIEIQESEPPHLGVEAAFAALKYRLDSITNSSIALAENWGVCMVAEYAGYEEVWQESETGCRVCQSGWVEVSNIQPSGVPPYSTHPNCGCKVHIRQR